MKILKIHYSLLFLMLLISACGGNKYQSKGAIPRDEPPSPYGNPKQYVALGKKYYVLPSSKGFKQRGIASWYGTDFHGKRTSSGTRYNMNAYSAAHKTLPIPTYVRVTNLENKKHLIVRVDDRGPFKEGRIIDLSYKAAKELGVDQKGLARVEIEALSPYQDLNRKKIKPSKEALLKAPISNEYLKHNEHYTENQLDQMNRQQIHFDVKEMEEAEVVLDNDSKIQSKPKYIQLGAFSDLTNAKNMVKRYQGHFESQAAIKQEKNLYKVFVGPYQSSSEFEKAMSALKAKGFL